MGKIKIPTRVTLDITADKIIIKVMSGRNVIETITKKRDGDGSFIWKSPDMDKTHPEFSSELDSFYSTDIAEQLREFADDVHPDQHQMEDLDE